MNQSFAKVVSYLTGEENIENVPLADLQKLADEHPYFPVTQFLLAKGLQGKSENEFLSQAQKSSLYFSNPYWLSYQLSDDSFQNLNAQQKEQTLASIEPPQETEAATDVMLPEALVPILPSSIEPTTEPALLAENAEEKPIAPGTEIEPEEALAPVTITEEAEPISTEPQHEGVSQEEEEQAAITRTTNEESETFIEDLTPDEIDANDTDGPMTEDFSPAAETEVIELEEEMAGVTVSADESTKHFLDEIKLVTVPPIESDEHDKMFQNIKAMLDASSEEADADTNNAVIPMDPYYTIDYFASQGIKLEFDQNPQDQLGQHLKKFTQWLKHMKKLGPEDATEAIIRTESEADIQQIADSSNTVREVVTEAMASVLEKQGKIDKAIELYNKLSFLNPHKNAYFADKIKKLKGI